LPFWEVPEELEAVRDTLQKLNRFLVEAEGLGDEGLGLSIATGATGGVLMVYTCSRNKPFDGFRNQRRLELADNECRPLAPYGIQERVTPEIDKGFIKLMIWGWEAL